LQKCNQSIQTTVLAAVKSAASGVERRLASVCVCDGVPGVAMTPSSDTMITRHAMVGRSRCLLNRVNDACQSIAFTATCTYCLATPDINCKQRLSAAAEWIFCQRVFTFCAFVSIYDGVLTVASLSNDSSCVFHGRIAKR